MHCRYGQGLKKARSLSFQEKFRWPVHNICAMQGDKILETKKEEGLGI